MRSRRSIRLSSSRSRSRASSNQQCANWLTKPLRSISCHLLQPPRLYPLHRPRLLQPRQIEPRRSIRHRLWSQLHPLIRRSFRSWRNVHARCPAKPAVRHASHLWKHKQSVRTPRKSSRWSLLSLLLRDSSLRGLPTSLTCVGDGDSQPSALRQVGASGDMRRHIAVH